MKKYKKIYIEITNNCNLNCSFCSKVNKTKRFMTIDKFNSILEKVKDYTDYIYLHVKGESLLHPNIIEFINLASTYNIKVNLTTNGTLISNHIMELSKCNNLNKINFSLHSENNIPNYLENIFDNVEKLPKRITVVYRLWINKKSTKIVDKIIKYYKLSRETVDKVKSMNNTCVKDNIYIDKDTEFEWPTINNHKSEGYCYALKTQIAILVDGTLVPCCLDSDGIINLGNIYKQDLSSIINSDRYKNLQKSFQNRKPCEKLCKSCTFKERLN